MSVYSLCGDKSKNLGRTAQVQGLELEIQNSSRSLNHKSVGVSTAELALHVAYSPSVCFCLPVLIDYFYQGFLFSPICVRASVLSLLWLFHNGFSFKASFSMYYSFFLDHLLLLLSTRLSQILQRQNPIDLANLFTPGRTIGLGQPLVNCPRSGAHPLSSGLQLP